MPGKIGLSGKIRKLRHGEEAKLEAHFLRLDATSRRLRFSGPVADDFIRRYSETAFRLNSVIHCYVVDGAVRAVAELRPIDDHWPQEAEAAFSVEKDYQDSGIGTELMDRVLLTARNRGISTLHMVCLAENQRMQHIARKHEAALYFDRGDVSADLDPAWPSYFSLLRESVNDGNEFVSAVLHNDV
ncbi:MAG: GNAT family N-acetyltransferase [Fimbriimonadaceae bacterium]|nr:GNAT family N-acetyltransferase [Alphaproteobacteria bacterium]